MVSRAPITALMREVGCPEEKVVHCQDVALVAVVLATALRNSGHAVDLDIVETAALLHDIGIAFTGDDISPEHCALGADFVRQRGYSEAAARCVERHEMGGITREEAEVFAFPRPLRDTYLPQTLEEKSVAFADLMYFTVVEAREDPWTDNGAAARALYDYADACHRKRTGGSVPSDYGVFTRATTLTKELLPYLPRDVFQHWVDQTSPLGVGDGAHQPDTKGEGGQ